MFETDFLKDDFEQCCTEGDLEKLKNLIINHHISPRWNNDYGVRLSSKNGHLHILQYLIEEQECDLCVDNGYALIDATRSNHLHVVKYFFEKLGQNFIYLSNFFYSTSLAIQNNYFEITKFFVDLESEREIKYSHIRDTQLEANLLYACECNHLEIVKYILEKITILNTKANGDGEDSDPKQKAINTGFCRAASSGHLTIVKFFLSQGANVHENDDYGLRFASWGNYLDVVKFLVEECSVDVQTDENSPLEWASSNNHYEIMKYLIDKGAPMDHPCVKDNHRFKKYILFCEKNILKRREKAQKIIYFWWIPICYSLDHPSGCGKRMMERNVEETFKLFLEN